MLKTLYEIWIFLKEKGGIDEANYDFGLINELKYSLKISLEDNFEESLKNYDISNEQFLSVFFKVVQPYSEMLGDLLKLFSELGAKQTNENISIRFDFGNKLHDFDFNVEEFKDWIEAWENVYGKIKVRQWEISSLWELDRCLRTTNAEINLVIPNEVEKWSYEYRQLGIWPEFFLPIPSTDDSAMDLRLSQIWKIWKTVVKESSRYGKNRDALRKFENTNDEIEFKASHDHNYKSLNEYWPIHILRGLDSDFWAGALVIHIHQCAIFVKNEIKRGNTTFLNQLIESIDDVFGQTTVIEQEANYLVKVIEEFLKLPFWKKRHELYSVWVFSQIYYSLCVFPVKAHVTNNSLKFSFSGSHLATISGKKNNFHLWSELRSSIKKPIGKGRKNAIQPDYSIIGEPITSTDSSILEIACKQYLKPLYKNFSDALNDYAKGRPSANVILVNYGHISDIIFNKVDINYLNRVSAIGSMRPGVKESIDNFKEIIVDTISKYSNIESELENVLTLNSLLGKAKIQLTWDNKPKDLDLHLFLNINNEIQQIYYNSKGTDGDFPYCYLEQDITDGYGSEIITISRWEKGKYFFNINNYSNETKLNESNAKIILIIDNKEYQFNCPKNGNGNWWNVFYIDSQIKIIKPINRISNHLFVEKVVFEDNFNDNKNDWAETESERVLKITNNRYIFIHKRESGNWYSYKTVPIALNRNFEIHTLILITSSSDSSYYKVLVDFKDLDNFIAFCINSKGSFKIYRRVENNISQIAGWTYSPVINEVENYLIIKKDDNNLIFFANSTKLYEFEIQPFQYSKIGFGLENKIGIEIHNIKIIESGQ